MHVGERIRQAREARGLSLEAISRVTRVSPAALGAIDRNDVASLPPYPYNKGFIEAYAHEIGLEPHETARDFLDQFATSPAPVEAETYDLPAHVLIEGRPRRVIWLAVPVVGLLLLMLVSRNPVVEEPAASGEPAGTAEPESPSAAAQPVSAAVESAPAPGPASSAAHAQALSVVLEARGLAWVEAHSDGRRVLYELLEAGDSPNLSADRELRLRVGDAGAVSLTVNKRPVGVLGASGAVRDLLITRENEGTIR
jgi:cytoskeletal protein RodZ